MVRLCHCVTIFLFVQTIQAARTGNRLYLQFKLYRSAMYIMINLFSPDPSFFPCKICRFVFFFFFEVYTFEDASHLTDFEKPATSTLELTTTRYKDGGHSLKWTWASGDAITHSFPTNVRLIVEICYVTKIS